MDDTITPTRVVMALLNPATAAPMLADAFDFNQFSKQEMISNITNNVLFDDYLEMLMSLSPDEKQDLIDLALQTVVDSPPFPGEIPRFLTSILSKDEFCRLASVMQLCQPAEEDTLWENYRTAWRSCRMDQHFDLRYRALQHSPDSGYETPPRLQVLGQPLHPQTIVQLPAPSITQPPLLQTTAIAQAQPTVQPHFHQPGSADQQSTGSEDHADASAPQISPKPEAKPKVTRKVNQKAKPKALSKVVPGALSVATMQKGFEAALSGKHRKSKKRRERRRKSKAADDSNGAPHSDGAKLEVETQSSPKPDLVQELEPVQKPEPMRESESVQERVARNTNAERKQGKAKAEKRREQKKEKHAKDKEARRKARKQKKLDSMGESTHSPQKSPSLSTPNKIIRQAKLDAPSSPALHEIKGLGVLPKASAATNKSVKFYDAPSTPLDLGRYSPSRSPLSLKASRVAAQSSPQDDSSSAMIEHAETPALMAKEDDSLVKQSGSTGQTKFPTAPHEMANPARFGPLGDPSSTSVQIPRGPNNPANKIQAQIDEMAAADPSDSDSDSDSHDDAAVERNTRRKDNSVNASRLSTDESLPTRPIQANGQSSQQQDDKENMVPDVAGGEGPAAGSSSIPAATSAAAGSGLFSYTQQVKAALRDDYGSVGLAPDGNETPIPVGSTAEDDLDVNMTDSVAEQHNLQPPSPGDENTRSSPHHADTPYFIEDDAQAELPSLSSLGETVPRQNHDASGTLSRPQNDGHVGRTATDSDVHDEQAVLQLRGEFESSYRRQGRSHAASDPGTPSPPTNNLVEVIIYRSSEKQRRQLREECLRAEPLKSSNNEAVLESEHEDGTNGDGSAAGEDSSPLSELDETPSPPAWNKGSQDSSNHEVSPDENKHKSKKRKRKSTGATSDHFDTPPRKRRVPAGVSTAAFPPTSNKYFGLIQEELWRDPFRLLVAVTFLNKTTGKSAVPVYRLLMEKYPTPEDLAVASHDEVCAMIQRLGLQNMRAKKLIRLAQDWIEDPPRKSRLHRTMHYPEHGNGSTYRPSTILEEDTEKCEGFLEVGHFYGLGPYAWDSWRIFCRDVLRGVATDYNGKDAADPDFEPEWKRVLPNDKELRACLQWMWLREGYDWDSMTGIKVEADAQMLQKAAEGMTVWPVPEETREEFLSKSATTSNKVSEEATGAERVTDDGDDEGRIETASAELDWEPRRGTPDPLEDDEVMVDARRKGRAPVREASIEL